MRGGLLRADRRGIEQRLHQEYAMSGIFATTHLTRAIEQERLRAATRRRLVREARRAARKDGAHESLPVSAWSSLLIAVRSKAA